MRLSIGRPGPHLSPLFSLPLTDPEAVRARISPRVTSVGDAYGFRVKEY